MKWYFPPTGGGVLYGFNDSSQEHFRVDAWDSTIREIIQNSLDAADVQKNKPVVVNISEITIPAHKIAAKDLAKHMDKALERTKQEKNARGIKFYQNALKALKQDEIKVLAITDANTTGLVDEKWNALVYDEGTTSKNMSASGGSFGIGKNAPYLVSSIQTVGYSTRYFQRKTSEKKQGRMEQFIIRCKISSHENPKQSNGMLQHIGFGTREKFLQNQRPAPTTGKNIYDEFRLDGVGSGIFIIGFEPKVKDWIKIAKESIARNFFVAIHEKKLEVNINSEIINYETLDNIFENGRKTKSHHYYRIIRDSNTKQSIEGNIGRFTVKLNIHDEDLPNRIAYVNRRGMLITDEKSFKKNPFTTSVGSGWAKYAGVVMAQDDKTDEKIREMEPPNHQAIEFKRVNDEGEREATKKDLKQIQKKIEDFVKEHINTMDEENNIQLPELAEILPTPGGDKGSNLGHNEGIELQHHTITPSPSRQTKNNPESWSDVDLPGRSGRGSDKGTRSRSKQLGDKNESKHDMPFLVHPRIVRDENKLHVAFTPKHDDDKPIHIAIMRAGEEKRNESEIPIIAVNVISPPRFDVKKEGNHIVMTSKCNERIVLDLEIPENESYTGYEIVEIIQVDKSLESKK